MNIVIKVKTVVENGDFKVISVQPRIDKKQIIGSDEELWPRTIWYKSNPFRLLPLLFIIFNSDYTIPTNVAFFPPFNHLPAFWSVTLSSTRWRDIKLNILTCH